MAKVTIVDIKKLVKDHVDHTDEEWFMPEFDELAVIPTPKGVVVSDHDAVHYTATMDEKFKIALYRNYTNEKGHRCMEGIPSQVIEVPVRDLLEDPGVSRTEEELAIFVRTFGSRIEGNYATLLDTLEEYGLNPGDYPRSANPDVRTTRL
jgi:hypothetical protein